MRLYSRIGAAALLILAATALVAGDMPWVGKWKFNASKSDLGHVSVTYSKTASGDMQFTADGQSYTFKMDSKDYPALFGYTAAWKQVDENTWENTVKLNGKVISVDTAKLSPDSKTLTYCSKGKRPSGEAFEDTTVFQRDSGGPGLPGKWLTKNMKSSAPMFMELSANGSDGITFTIPDQKASCQAKFDGKDYPLVGPQMPPGFAIAFKRLGARSFEITVKNNGKPAYLSTFTVSDDGKTLTESGSAVGVGEKYKYVSDRQ